MKTVRSSGEKRKPESAPAKPAKPIGRHPEPSTATGAEREARERTDSAKNYKTALRSYRFQRARTPGIIEVLNENSYVMAEYSERTGSVKWQRMVLASQREQIEKWLDDHYSRRGSA